MKSVFILLLFVFMGILWSYTYATESDSQRDCVVKYLNCKDMCDYYENKNISETCKDKCNRKYTCRPEKKDYKIRSLYD